MTIETKYICDKCKKEIRSELDIAFTMSSVICGHKLEAHFCSIDCFKSYVNRAFKDPLMETIAC